METQTQPHSDVIHLNGGQPLLKERARMVRVNNNPEFAKAIAQAAAADAHQCIAPTHAMMKGDQIIGYLSLGGMPVVQAWFDSKNPHVLDSLKMIEHGETALAEAGAQAYMVAVADESPFRPHMERLGFIPLYQPMLYFKRLG